MPTHEQEVFILQRIEAERLKAVKLLLALSPDALGYVLKPIRWAWAWTDQNDPDSMSEEDTMRFSIIAAGVHENPLFITCLYRLRRAMFLASLKKKQQEQEERP